MRFCSVAPLICVIDDILYLDKWSWHLVLSLHKNCDGLLLVMATEPMNRTYMAALETTVPRVGFSVLFQRVNKTAQTPDKENSHVADCVCDQL